MDAGCEALCEFLQELKVVLRREGVRVTYQLARLKDERLQLYDAAEPQMPPWPLLCPSLACTWEWLPTLALSPEAFLP